MFWCASFRFLIVNLRFGSPFKFPGCTYAPNFFRYKRALNTLGLQNDQRKICLVCILGSPGLFEAFYKMIWCFCKANMENKRPNHSMSKCQGVFCRIFQLHVKLRNHPELYRYRCFKNHFVLVPGGHPVIIVDSKTLSTKIFQTYPAGGQDVIFQDFALCHYLCFPMLIHAYSLQKDDFLFHHLTCWLSTNCLFGFARTKIDSLQNACSLKLIASL